MNKNVKMFNMNCQSEDCMTPVILKGRDLMKKRNQRRLGAALLTALMTMCVTIGSVNTGSFFNENMQITASASQQDDIVAIALAEEGYEEGANNWTKYGDWYGMNNVAWCAIFISWAADQAGISRDIINKNAWAGDMGGSECTGNFGGHYYPRSYVLNGWYTPVRGDVVYYDGSDVNGSSGHVELVVDYDPSTETITSIGGNTGGGYRVFKHTGQSLHTNGTSMTIIGFEHPNYETEPDLIINDEPIAPYPRPTGYVRKGDKNLYVGWVQYCLFKQLGYGDESDVVDCDFGSATLLAVKTFQENYGLEVDGVVGTETINKMIELITQPEPDPIPSGSIMSTGAGQTLPDGDYFIYSPLKENFYLDINGADVPAALGTNVHMWTASRKPTAKDACDAWTLKYLNNGFYKIFQKGTNMCLDVKDGSLLRGTNVQVWSEHEDTPEQWSISKTSTGYKIQARCGGFCLDVAGAETNDGTNIRVWEDNDSMAQKFTFVPYTVEEETTATTTITTTTTTTTTTTATTFKTDAPVVLRPGDVNSDKIIDVSDAVLLARFIAEDPEVVISRTGLTAADINADGSITSDDTITILQMIAKIL